MLDDTGGGWSSGSGACGWGPAVDDARHWFWTTLDRWPDPRVTNGPRIVSPSAEQAYGALRDSLRGEGELRRAVIEVTVASDARGNREILGATVKDSSGDPVLDALARRLYPAWDPTLPVGSAPAGSAPVDVFRVSAYGRSLPAEVTFDL